MCEWSAMFYSTKLDSAEIQRIKKLVFAAATAGTKNRV